MSVKNDNYVMIHNNKNCIQTHNSLQSLLFSAVTTISILYKPEIISSDYIFSIASSNDPFLRFLVELRINTSGWGSTAAYLMIGLFCFYRVLYERTGTISSNMKKKNSIVYFILSAIFSIFTISGKAFLYTKYIGVIYHSTAQMFLSLLSLLGYFVFFFLQINLIDSILTTISKPTCTISSKNRILFFLLDKHPFISSFSIMIILEVPFYFFFYPGTAMADGLLQLTMYYGQNALSNHHPIFSTLIMGLLNDLGRHIGDNNFGLFTYVFLQSLIQFMLFASIMVLSKKYAIDYKLRIGILIFLSLFSVFQMYAITLVKDTSYSLSFLAFTLCMIKCWFGTKKNLGWYIVLFISGLFVWMFRNNGLYIVIAGYLCLMFRKQPKGRIYLLILLIFSTMGMNFWFHTYIMPSIGASEGSVREALSIPTQQTARYCLQWPNDITIEERKVIEEVFNCSIEDLGKRYNPELSNNVKESFLFSPSKKQLETYFSIWWKQFLRHPGTYIDAFGSQCYGYLYPDRQVFDAVSYYDIPSYILSDAENENLNLSQNTRFSAARVFYNNIHNLFAKLPIISYLYSCGFYTWLLLFLFAFLIFHHKARSCVILLPSFLNVIVCCVSPVDAYLRYQLPVITVMPLLVIYVMASVRSSSSMRECSLSNEKVGV